MCRHLAYVGPPIALESLLYDPPHSLAHQSWAPRQQRHGTVNADGYGVGWYAPEVRKEPARYRRAGPIWTDRSLRSLAGIVRSGGIVAAVRSATPPAPIEETGAAPFTDGSWLFSLNGRVTGDLTGLHRRLTDTRLAGLEGTSDAELVFGLMLDQLDDGGSPAAALGWAVSSLPGRLNMLLSDGTTVWATTSGETLSWRPWEGGVVVASEPLDDDPSWVDLPQHVLVVANPEGCAVTPLPSRSCASPSCEGEDQ